MGGRWLLHLYTSTGALPARKTLPATRSQLTTSTHAAGRTQQATRAPSVVLPWGCCNTPCPPHPPPARPLHSASNAQPAHHINALSRTHAARHSPPLPAPPTHAAGGSDEGCSKVLGQQERVVCGGTTGVEGERDVKVRPIIGDQACVRAGRVGQAGRHGQRLWGAMRRRVLRVSGVGCEQAGRGGCKPSTAHEHGSGRGITPWACSHSCSCSRAGDEPGSWERTRWVALHVAQARQSNALGQDLQGGRLQLHTVGQAGGAWA